MEDIRKVLDQKQIEYEVFETEQPRHATELTAQLAQRDDISCIVSVGGDGTLSETVQGIAGTGKTLAVIPAGTGNDFIKTVGIQSAVFLFAFLPIVFGLCLLPVPLKVKNVFLIFASLFFYAYGEPVYVLLMLASSLVNYLFGRLLGMGSINEFL